LRNFDVPNLILRAVGDTEVSHQGVNVGLAWQSLRFDSPVAMIFARYGVPSPPKFNVSFYVLLFAFYPTFVV